MAAITTDMHGKLVLITGASDGIGKATALGLAKLGAQIVMPVRNQEKGERAAAQIRTSSGNNDVTVMNLDLASLASVHAFADAFKQKYQRLDVLINNAGGYNAKRSTTVDGMEMTFETNVVGPFVLTNELLDLVKASAPARIVILSSTAENFGKINFADLQSEKSYPGFRVYGTSKLMNLMWSYDLARRLQGSGVVVNAMHPGFVNSSFGNGQTGITGLGLNFVKSFAITPEKAAETAIYLAASPETANVTGKYFMKSKAHRSSGRSYDTAVQQRLWQTLETIAQRDAVRA